MSETVHKIYGRTGLQGLIAILSFSSGVILAFICICFIEPIGEISSSAISIVSELLVLCGGLLGLKVSYDTKLKKMEGEIIDRIKKADHA